MGKGQIWRNQGNLGGAMLGGAMYARLPGTPGEVITGVLPTNTYTKPKAGRKWTRRVWRLTKHKLRLWRLAGVNSCSITFELGFPIMRGFGVSFGGGSG